ncbi:hypothetical protein [Microbispora sp. H10670]|uniref:ATP-dependent DNA ligase n=1 Tax=Microbispora sp. H10670 TaxID=2729108 RepID=UPI00287304C0|nr:hypothetical protein [Microbispora sp. H10670]
MADKLETYRAKRDPARTGEPMPADGPSPRGEDDTFVIQEHHAKSLHADGADVTAEHRWLRPLAESLGSRAVILDGEVAALGATLGYVCYDLLYDDGRSLLDEPFERRRTRLEALAVNGPRWQTAPSWPGEVHAVRRAAAEQGLPGVVGKRLDSAYAPGEESAAWVRLPGKRDGAG